MVRLTYVMVMFSWILFGTSSCAPIIKTSGVQWSEPIGTGKGNITILMMPQNSACSNDSDLVVAVKSDYQILSQDTQLLNLVVNENVNNKSDVNTNACLRNNTSCNSKDFIENEELVKKENNFVAKYFEPEKKLPLQLVNTSVDPVLFKSLNHLNGSKSSNDNGIINIYKFLNVSNLNQVDVYQQPNTYQEKSRIAAPGPGNNTNTELKSRHMQNSYTKAKSDNKHNVTFLVAKKDSAVRGAIDILKKINQELYPSLRANPNKEEATVNGNGEAKSNVLISKFAEDELVEKDFKHLEDHGHNLAQLEGNAQSGTTCWPFFFSFSNEQPTFMSEVRSNSPVTEIATDKSKPQNGNNEYQNIYQMLTAPSTVGAGIGGTAASSVISISRQEFPSSEETTPSNTLANNEKETTLKVEYESTPGSVLAGNAQIQKKITLEPPILCETKIGIGGESKIESQNELTTKAILEGNQAIPKNITLEAPVICQTIGNTTIPSIYEVTTGSVLEGSGLIPKKITMEPPVNCETLVPKTNDNSSTLNAGQDNGQNNSGNLTLPLVESSVVIANNDEMPKGKDISLSLNSSLEEFPWSDVHDGGEKTNGRMCEQFNGNSLSLGGDQELPQIPSKLTFVLSKKGMTGDRNRLKQQGKIDEIHFSPNKILKLNSDGNNLLEKKIPPFLAEKNNVKESDSKGFKPNVYITKDKSSGSSNIDPNQNLMKNTESCTTRSILKSSTLFRYEEALTIFDNTSKNPFMYIYETPQANFNKEWTKRTYSVSSSTEYFKEYLVNNELTFRDNISINQPNSYVTAPMFQTYYPNGDNFRISYFTNNENLQSETKLPTNKPILCKKKNQKLSSKQESNKENIEISGNSVQEILIKLVKNTNSPKMRKKNVKKNKESPNKILFTI